MSDPADNPGTEGQPSGQPSGQPNNQPWHGDLDETTRGFLQNKSWLAENPVETVSKISQGYKNLEAFHGVPAEQLLRLPGKDADASEWSAVYDKLGRPQEPAGYEIPVPDGQDGSFAEKAKSWFHEAGLTPAQAKVIAEKWNGELGALQESQRTETEAKRTEQVNQLRQEWGELFDKHVNQAGAAAEKLGVTEQQQEALRQVMGTGDMVKFFHSISQSLGEADFVSGNNPLGNGGGMTPEQAKAEISKLNSDDSFVAKLMDKTAIGHKEAVEKRQRLYSIAYDG